MLSTIDIVQGEIDKFSVNTKRKKSLELLRGYLRGNSLLSCEFDKVVNDSVTGEWKKNEILNSLSVIFGAAEFWDSDEGRAVLEDFDSDDVLELLIGALNNKKIDDGRVIKSRRGKNGGFYLFSEVDSTSQVMPVPEESIEGDGIDVLEDRAEQLNLLKENEYYPFVQHWAMESGWAVSNYWRKACKEKMAES